MTRLKNVLSKKFNRILREKNMTNHNATTTRATITTYSLGGAFAGASYGLVVGAMTGGPVGALVGAAIGSIGGVGFGQLARLARESRFGPNR